MSRFQERRAWAIEHRWPEHPNGGLLGVGYFGWPELTQEHRQGDDCAIQDPRVGAHRPRSAPCGHW